MVDTINVTDLTIMGRIDAPDPKTGQIAVQKNLNFNVQSSYSLNFGSINQGQQIGVIRTLFCDNTNNPSEIVVTTMGTGQRFTVPAFAEGYFPIVSKINGTIILESDGGATKPIVTIFFNYDFPIGVWYKYGAVNKDIAQKTQGALPDGSNIDGQYSNSNLIAGRDPNGKVKTFATDAYGAMLISNLAVTIGAIFGPDAIGTAPTHPGVLFAALDSAGKVINVTLNADGEFRTYDSKVRDSIVTLNGKTDALDAKLAAIVESTAKGVVGTVTSVAASVAVGGVQLLPANAERQAATVFNDSAETLYLSLSASDVTNAAYSVKVIADGYYEVPAKYTGIIKGLWTGATGSAKVTELI